MHYSLNDSFIEEKEWYESFIHFMYIVYPLYFTEARPASSTDEVTKLSWDEINKEE